MSAAQLGTLLGLTPAAIRRHLDYLEKAGVVEVKLVRGSGQGAGRPARRYVLSTQGQSVLGNDYLEVAQLALRELVAREGEEAMKDFATRRFAAMEERYAPRFAQAGTDIAQRARVLSEALSEDGYIASSSAPDSRQRPVAQGPMRAVQLCQGHCPVLALAAEHPEFCEAETAAFTRMLGVDVRRLSTLASGGHVCTTHIPTGRLGVMPGSDHTTSNELRTTAKEAGNS
ncbi:ArsR family transcriptional regulator [Psychromicrobium xiongbiense]|uniref:helix-turn-helix transcriptional regulator n=1 Tax=Psychromicrobium xiongbiense TaxID=3051184 RepID=UPI003075C32D